MTEWMLALFVKCCILYTFMSAQTRRLGKILCANLLLWGAAIGWQFQEPKASATLSPEETAATISRPVPVITKKTEISIPEAVVVSPAVTLSVPFTSQAPYEDWSAPYQEACEEAALLMIDAYMQGTTLPASVANEKILSLTDAVAKAGYGESMTIAELATFVQQWYGFRSRIIEDVTVESIKEELRAGHPVIVPAAGKELQNPYFSGGGPWYHMLVITGFDEDEFITNDPGTVLGHGFRYQQDHLLSAIHDWTGQEQTISEGKKVMLILEPALSY